MQPDRQGWECAEVGKRLAADCKALGVPLSASLADTLLSYLALLQRWNATYNLTSIREPAQMLSHHLADCLALIAPLRAHAEGRKPTRVLDVGSGAGLPGIVIAACEAPWQVSCIDTVGKKAAFIRQAAAELRLGNLQGVHGRVEQWKADAPFDIVVSRAFASLADFVTLSRSQLSDDGCWVAMKGKSPEGEIAALPSDVAVFHVEQLQVPGLDAERCLVWIRPI